MPTDRFNNPRRFHWGLVGVSMVTIAVGLAIIGIVMAFQQAHSVTTRLLTELQLRARYIARSSNHQVQKDITTEMTLFAENSCLAAENFELTEVTLSYLRSSWRQMIVWNESADESMERNLKNIFYTTKKDATDQQIQQTRAAIQSFLATSEEAGPAITFVHFDPWELALLQKKCKWNRRGLSIVCIIDVEKLRSEVIDPFVNIDEGLELVTISEMDQNWATPLSGILSRWAIQPSHAFLAEQRHAVLWQTGTYAGLTLVALLAMFAVMWLLSRLARREMALAELKSNFVADVSHELKTPLAMIRMYAETLQSGRVNSEPKRSEYYAIMVRESTRLANLINNILDFARIEAGRKEYTLEPTDVAEAVRSTYDTYREELERNEFEHHLSIDGDLPPVNADRGAIVQILVNLISNGMKYSGEERYLSIDVQPDTRRDHHGVIIAVEDHGIGIRPEDRARVFEGFFRAADGRVQRQGGTGLGLTLVKHIVDAHGGILDIESRLVKGTVFRVFLPAIDGATGDRKPMRSGSEP